MAVPCDRVGLHWRLPLARGHYAACSTSGKLTSRAFVVYVVIQADAAAPGAGGAPVLLFDVSKRETHHPNSGFKKLFRRVRANFKCDVYVPITDAARAVGC